MSSHQQGQQHRAGVWERTSNKMNSSTPETLLRCTRIFNIIMSVAVLIVGVTTFVFLDTCDSDVNKSRLGIVSIYAIVFAILLLVTETVAERRTKEFIDHNFGFLYTHRGKALLVIFLGTLCFSSIVTSCRAWVLNLVVGLLVVGNGIFLCCAYYSHPTFGTIDLGPKKYGLDANISKSQPSMHTDTSSSMSQGPRSDYQFGEANVGPAYGRYNESPFVISESTPQPFNMDDNPYGDIENEGGRPFATGQSNGMTTISMEDDQNENPFHNDNPFAQR